MDNKTNLIENCSLMIEKFMLELLQDNQPHSVEEIKEYVITKLGHTPSPGQFSGAIYRTYQSHKNNIHKINRGIYQLIIESDENNFLQNRVIEILDDALISLRNLGNTFNLLDVTEKELRDIQIVREVLHEIMTIQNRIKN
jgi:hypothetical protein